MTSSAMTKRGGSRLRSPWLAVPGLLVLFAATARGEATRGVYAVAPGDTIAVSVLGREDLSCQVRVPREGNVMLPGAGVVRVTGQGVEDLSARVAALLEANERLLKARVVVSVISYGVRRAFVYGAASEARAMDLPAETDITLTQAVASCGGFAPDADRARVRITRRKPGEEAQVIVVDASIIAEGETPELDPFLEPGDTVYVPRRQPVYVLGQVQKQGALPLPFEYPLTVSKAVALSGGFTPYARHGRVLVTRRTPAGVEKFSVDVGAILVAGELDKDLELAPGDTVYVPERVF
jgi:polysaccharide export outer membrane protein